MRITEERICSNCHNTLTNTEDYKLQKVSFDTNENAMYELICPHCGKVFWEFPWNVKYEEFSD